MRFNTDLEVKVYTYIRTGYNGQIALLEDVFISFCPVLIYCGLVSVKAIIYVTLEHVFFKTVPLLNAISRYKAPTNVFIMSFKYTMLYFRSYFLLFFFFEFYLYLFIYFLLNFAQPTGTHI